MQSNNDLEIKVKYQSTLMKDHHRKSGYDELLNINVNQLKVEKNLLNSIQISRKSLLTVNEAISQKSIMSRSQRGSVCYTYRDSVDSNNSQKSRRRGSQFNPLDVSKDNNIKYSGYLNIDKKIPVKPKTPEINAKLIKYRNSAYIVNIDSIGKNNLKNGGRNVLSNSSQEGVKSRGKRNSEIILENVHPSIFSIKGIIKQNAKFSKEDEKSKSQEGKNENNSHEEKRSKGSLSESVDSIRDTKQKNIKEDILSAKLISTNIESGKNVLFNELKNKSFRGSNKSSQRSIKGSRVSKSGGAGLSPFGILLQDAKQNRNSTFQKEAANDISPRQLKTGTSSETIPNRRKNIHTNDNSPKADNLKPEEKHNESDQQIKTLDPDDPVNIAYWVKKITNIKERVKFFDRLIILKELNEKDKFLKALRKNEKVVKQFINKLKDRVAYKKDHLQRTKAYVSKPLNQRKRHNLVVISDQKLAAFKSSMKVNKDHLKVIHEINNNKLNNLRDNLKNIYTHDRTKSFSPSANIGYKLLSMCKTDREALVSDESIKQIQNLNKSSYKSKDPTKKAKELISQIHDNDLNKLKNVESHNTKQIKMSGSSRFLTARTMNNTQKSNRHEPKFQLDKFGNVQNNVDSNQLPVNNLNWYNDENDMKLDTNVTPKTLDYKKIKQIKKSDNIINQNRRSPSQRSMNTKASVGRNKKYHMEQDYDAFAKTERIFPNFSKNPKFASIKMIRTLSDISDRSQDKLAEVMDKKDIAKSFKKTNLDNIAVQELSPLNHLFRSQNIKSQRGDSPKHCPKLLTNVAKFMERKEKNMQSNRGISPLNKKFVIPNKKVYPSSKKINFLNNMATLTNPEPKAKEKAISRDKQKNERKPVIDFALKEHKKVESQINNLIKFLIGPTDHIKMINMGMDESVNKKEEILKNNDQEEDSKSSNSEKSKKITRIESPTLIIHKEKLQEVKVTKFKITQALKKDGFFNTAQQIMNKVKEKEKKDGEKSKEAKKKQNQDKQKKFLQLRNENNLLLKCRNDLADYMIKFVLKTKEGQINSDLFLRGNIDDSLATRGLMKEFKHIMDEARDTVIQDDCRVLFHRNGDVPKNFFQNTNKQNFNDISLGDDDSQDKKKSKRNKNNKSFFETAVNTVEFIDVVNHEADARKQLEVANRDQVIPKFTVDDYIVNQLRPYVLLDAPEPNFHNKEIDSLESEIFTDSRECSFQSTNEVQMSNLYNQSTVIRCKQKGLEKFQSELGNSLKVKVLRAIHDQMDNRLKDIDSDILKVYRKRDKKQNNE